MCRAANGRTQDPDFTASRQGSARLPLDPAQSPTAWSGVQTCEEGAKALVDFGDWMGESDDIAQFW